jgi:nucleoside 2-deoxyribosyltransferase
MKIYFAGPLFSEAERDWIRGVKQEIEKAAKERGFDLKVVWPYELITREEIDLLGDTARNEIFERCRSNLDDADMVIALLDGTQVDDGTAWEIGYFYAGRSPGRKIIGIRTDFRCAGECEGACVNIMIERACDRIVRNREGLLEVIFTK